MKYIPVEGNEGLVRDTETGAILSIDTKARDAAIARKERVISTEQRLTKLEDKISNIETLLQRIAEKL